MHARANGPIRSVLPGSVKLYSANQYQSPIMSLEHFEDYVTDVKWHPTHPAVF